MAGGRIVTADGESDVLQPGLRLHVLEKTLEQRFSDSLAAPLAFYIHAPDGAFVAGFWAGFAEKSSHPHEPAFHESSHDEISGVRGQSLSGTFDRGPAVLRRRFREGARLSLQSFQAESPVGFGVLGGKLADFGSGHWKDKSKGFGDGAGSV